MKKNYYVFLIIILILNAFMPLYFIFSKSETINKETLTYDTSKYIYLSDIGYDSEKSTTDRGTIIYDTTPDNEGIILNIDDEAVYFKKGIFAHANSEIIYDLTDYDYDYDYFTAYIGVNETKANKGNGVKFSIYTSNDGTNWDLRTNTTSQVMMGQDNAEYIKIEIKNIKYLKLQANDNGSNSNDYAVYADAKLVNSSYNEYNSTLRTIEQYDSYLKSNYEANKNNMSEEYELNLLQRELIKNVGYKTLQFMMSYDKDIEETINWLMNDLKTLRLFTVGGIPDGNASYGSAIDVLSKLYSKYKADLNDYNPTFFYNTNKDNNSYLNNTYFNKTKGDLYRTMMLSLSLTHATDVYFWADSSQVSDALTRYEIYKELYNNNKLDNEIFESLTVEEMRFIMNNTLDDNEIIWLNNYTKSTSSDSYHYVVYNDKYNYLDNKYYDSSNYKNFDKKYNLSAYNMTIEAGHPKLWVVFEEGGLSGAISKTGVNIASSWGIPATVIGQPGGTAYLIYKVNSNGQGYWSISNDVSGWAQSGRTEKLGIRMLNSWGEYEYATYTSSVKPDSYIILAQDALNEYDKYEKAEELIVLSKVFSNDNNKLLEIYENAIKAEEINFDAWYNLINLYKVTNKTEAEWYSLAERIVDAFAYYPLPMHDLLRQVETNLKSAEYTIKYANLHNNALRKSANATTENILQPSATKEVAEALLEATDDNIATFSFDGVNAGSIILSSRFANLIPSWEYSLNGGNSWAQANDKIKKLTPEEINSITSDNDIKIHLVNTDYNKDNIFTINIDKSNKPEELYANDLENRVIGATTTMEWRYSENDAWVSYTNASPNLKGNISVQVRYASEGTNLASDFVTLNFTEDNETDVEKYIPISELSVSKVSSEATNNNGYAKYAIDGNLNTVWHSNWNGQDSNRYIIIKLDKAVSLTALEYVPSQNENNGRIKTGTISVSTDGETFREIKSVSWEDSASPKKVQFEAIEAQYVKIQATSNYGDGRNFITASMFNLFRDASKDTAPTASIAYETKELTNQNVIVRLVNPSTEITITNNNGSDTYTFTKNGNFTFEFEDANGVKGKATAKVNWIDKDIPTAEIVYSPNSFTSKEVIATLTNFSEEVTILNNLGEEGNDKNGSDTYTFTANGEFVFRFQDKAGNIGTARAYVNWINKGASDGIIEYDVNEPTNGPVKASLKCDENIIVLNNNGNNTYNFTKNGTFKFMYQDIAGNISVTKANVDWITNEPIQSKIVDKTDNSSNNTSTNTSDIPDNNIVDNQNDEENILDNEDTSTSDNSNQGQTATESNSSSGNINSSTILVNDSNDSLNDTSNSINNKLKINKPYTSNVTLSTNETSGNHVFLYLVIFVFDLLLSSMFIYLILQTMQEEKENFSD